jgi:cation transport ATPase
MHGKHMNHDEHGDMHYKHLLIMTVLSFVSMYVFMYSMVNSFANVYSSLNQVFMAAVMTAPMVIIEIIVMRGMYQNRKKNISILILSVVALIVFFTFIRQQTAITDKQFLRSMIPHHAGAILMCEQTPAQSQTIKDLCKNIISSQQAEIEQMKTLLKDLN